MTMILSLLHLPDCEPRYDSTVPSIGCLLLVRRFGLGARRHVSHYALRPCGWRHAVRLVNEGENIEMWAESNNVSTVVVE